MPRKKLTYADKRRAINLQEVGPHHMTLRQAAKFLGVHERTIRRWIKQGIVMPKPDKYSPNQGWALWTPQQLRPILKELVYGKEQ